MKRKSQYDFLEGACFAYYDATFDECLQCSLANPCRNATESKDVSAVRAVAKTDSETIEQLARQYEVKHP